MKTLMKGNLPLCHKRKLINMCILRKLMYGAQTWPLTNQQRYTLEVCQRTMERSILGLRLADRFRNSSIRHGTGIKDIIKKAAKLKWDFLGWTHLSHAGRSVGKNYHTLNARR